MHLVRFETVNVDFAEDCAGAQGCVVAASTDVNLTVRHRRNREFYGVSGDVGGNLGTVPEFASEIRGVEGVQHGGTRARWSVISCAVGVRVNHPHNSVGVPV